MDGGVHGGLGFVEAMMTDFLSSSTEKMSRFLARAFSATIGVGILGGLEFRWPVGRAADAAKPIPDLEPVPAAQEPTQEPSPGQLAPST
jgi:hypothetical protein